MVWEMLARCVRINIPLNGYKPDVKKELCHTVRAPKDGILDRSRKTTTIQLASLPPNDIIEIIQLLLWFSYSCQLVGPHCWLYF